MADRRPSELAPWLDRQMRIKGWGLRAAERETGISKGAIDNILKNSDAIPNVDTLARLSSVFGVPFDRLVEMCGFSVPNYEDASGLAAAITRLAETQPDLRPALGRIAELRPGEVAGLVAYLDALEAQRTK